jgi:valyl-tRNA synthetase
MAKGESKSYDPAATEKRIFEMWMSGGYFHPQPDDRPPEKRFCMVIPPPNVTGALHLGHALNNTLQDILIRHHRMLGDNTFWLVGTDHAGIATQATVEKTIRKDEGKSRHDLGREELVRRIWEWKEKYGSRIVEQLKLMGCSCDYQRERFTLDEGCAKAVRETFFKLFRDGLIYRGKRLVNWDTQLQTAVADDEVYHETVKGHFYHLKYPIIDPKPGEPTHVHVATTRPETMLGDTAVAVHPDPESALTKVESELRGKLKEASEKDKPGIEAQLEDIAARRSSHLPTLIKLRDIAKAGRKVMLPLANREIPLIADEWAKPELGSGCVKITPAHDPNDYEVGTRHDLPMINILQPDGRLNEHGGKYANQKFGDARKTIVADLEALGLVEKIEERSIDLAHSDRSNSEIQPYLSDQWFVRMGDLEPEHAAKIEGLRDRSEPRPSGSGQRSNVKVAGTRYHSGLAQMAIDIVKRGDVTFHPARYESSYVDWLAVKRDWCISRQLWWGHRIPVWTAVIVHPAPGPANAAGGISGDRFTLGEFTRLVTQFTTGHVIVYRSLIPDRMEEAQICFRFEPSQAEQDLIQNSCIRQDPDVLDTWFSSALWPHSTLGWPETEKHDKLLNYFYPTSVLSTAREIITLWVARMVITGLYNIGEIPFHDVYIHALIMDAQGRKMSKTLGNGVDPVDIIDEYGADALRFTLAELATETQDIRIPVTSKTLPDGRKINISEKFEKGRNFCNKLWQAATGYVLRNLEGYDPQPLDPAKLRLEDRWILSRLTAAQQELDTALKQYRFSEAIGVLYHFMWDEYCSWYIEMTKSRVASSGGNVASGVSPDGVADTSRQVAQQILVHCLDQLLRMLHPIVPFVTEALWQELNHAAPKRGLRQIIDFAATQPALVAAAWPKADTALRDEKVEREMSILHDIIRAARDIRASINDYRGKAKQPSIRSLPAASLRADAQTCRLIETYRPFMLPLAGFEDLRASPDASKPAGAMSRVIGAMQLHTPVGDLIDLKEVARTEQTRLEELRGVLAKEESRLANADFVRNAKPEIVEQARQRLAELTSQTRAIESHLADMQ